MVIPSILLWDPLATAGTNTAIAGENPSILLWDPQFIKPMRGSGDRVVGPSILFWDPLTVSKGKCVEACSILPFNSPLRSSPTRHTQASPNITHPSILLWDPPIRGNKLVASWVVSLMDRLQFSFEIFPWWLSWIIQVQCNGSLQFSSEILSLVVFRLRRLN